MDHSDRLGRADLRLIKAGLKPSYRIGTGTTFSRAVRGRKGLGLQPLKAVLSFNLNPALNNYTLGGRGGAMKTKIVRYTQRNLPPTTKAERATPKALANGPDSEIDTSDTPEMTDEQ
jgi:hypothetical protein